MMCATIRECTVDFVAKNGPIPISGRTANPTKKIEMDKNEADWKRRFTAAFQVELANQIESALGRLQAAGQNINFVVPLLHQPLAPNDALSIAVHIFALTLRLDTVYERQVDDLQPQT